MKTKTCSIFLLMSTLILSGCGSTQHTRHSGELAGEWAIVEVEGKIIKAETDPFLFFNVAEHQFYGNAGCNNVMGTLEMPEAEQGVLSFGAVAGTKRMCVDMASEDAILQALGQVRGYAFEEENQLLLNDSAGKELIRLTRKKNEL